MSKQQRLEQANEFIKVVGSHGRRFFYNKTHDRYARLELDARGRVWFIDDYSGKRVYTHETTFTSKWRGFTHGGTLKDLVKALREYVVHGKPLHPGYVAPERSWSEGNIWGYGPEEARKVRQEAYKIPMFKQAA
ncbi:MULTISPECIES: hypothetical protein [Pseudomonas]|uniref:Uncharacterized protein n=1 Tax=Pseudomonas lutea TaxID=243924 RepID=A0A9X8MH78_9PSED|nr:MULTISPECIES: hypothetical protein [Pseudomonas]SER37697.1 hypothetical protein SAMN05216409_118107 [Pseudomonas lutea]